MSSGFIYFVCLMESCVIYARSHRTIIDSWFLHCFEDTKANYSTMPSDLKKRHLGSNPNFGFPYLVFGLYFVLCGFCLGLLGSRKERKGKSPLRFCATAFSLPSALPVQLHIATIVFFFRLHRARSSSLSQSLLDSTSTSF